MTVSKVTAIHAAMSQSELVGELLQRGDEQLVRNLFLAGAAPIGLAGGQPKDIVCARAGTIVRALREADGWRAREILAEPGSALAKMFHLAGAHELDPVFPEAVNQEVGELLNAPGIDDDALEDLTAVPFVTIDGSGTRDLDQALFIEPSPDGGWIVLYALADPAWCVRPGTALFEESLRRGASFYLPGLCVPMLPRALSEGITSLNENELRRAVVFKMTVVATGDCAGTEILRARIRSRSQLTFSQVGRFLDGKEHLPDRSAEPSVKCLRDVGLARMRRAAHRDVIHYRRTEVDVKLEGGLKFVIDLERRSRVERYNEQLSLMCNVEGARLLRTGDLPDDHVHPIYRVHPAPDQRRYRQLETLLEAIVRRHGLKGDVWRWRHQGEHSLADYLAALPTEGTEGRIASAIHRQAVLTNVRSVFSDQPAGHHGVGAEVYARFSAPMRELVGVFLHKELFEKIGGAAADDARDEELRGQIIARANASKSLQKRLTKEANRVVIDEMFNSDRQQPRQARGLHRGTVMGLTASKAHVLLDEPRIEVKVYARHQADVCGNAVNISEDGAAMLQTHADSGKVHELCRIGDPVNISVYDRDERGDRWMLVIN